MVAIVKELTIAATPERIFSALTQEDEMVLWWAYKAQVKPEIGSVGEFHFRQGEDVLRFEIAEMNPGKSIYWISRHGPPEWTGTSVTWQLTPFQDDGTTLVFTHSGFGQIDEAYRLTRMNWEYFLESLKSYIETGKGTPGLPLSHMR